MKDFLWRIAGIIFLMALAWYAGHEFESGYDVGYDHGYLEATHDCESRHEDMLRKEYDIGYADGYQKALNRK